MEDDDNPYQALAPDRMHLLRMKRRQRKLVNLAMGIGVALLVFILIWLPAIVRPLMNAFNDWLNSR